MRNIAEDVIVLAKEHRSLKIGETWEVTQKRSLCRVEKRIFATLDYCILEVNIMKLLVFLFSYSCGFTFKIQI